jgi:hypothetical protein
MVLNANLIGTKDTLDLYDFNRCDGTLSNLQNITVPDTGSLSAGLGCSFSPDSRFLYVSSYKRLYQYDTWAVNVNSSGILIAQYDSFFSPFQTLFNMHQIGSDGKIYISTWNGNNVMHVINTPDSLGLNCNFIQHSFILPTYNTTIPNFPNYDLGTWIGSSCDTLTAINETSKSNLNLKIFPNPASNYFYANYNLPSNSSAQLTIYNMFGQKISTHNLYGTFKTLMVHTEDLQNGIYIITVKSNKEELSVGRINIIK